MIGGLRIFEAVVQAAARPRRRGCRARYTSHDVQVYHGAIFIPPWRHRPSRKRANWWNMWYFNTKWAQNAEHL